MSLPFDTRTTREVIGGASTPTRAFKDSLSEQIVKNLSLATPSNYLSNQYGSNHRVIYETISALLADFIVDNLDLADDSDFYELRPEFLASKLTEIIFNSDTIPETDTDLELRKASIETLLALLQGSTEKSISELLLSQAGGSKVDLSQVSTHEVSLLSSVLAYTGFSDYEGVQAHRHYAVAPEKGVGATLQPIGYKWGDDLHTHEVIDGVVQPHTDGHTHTIEYGLPTNVVRLQSNLAKYLNTTKPAHLKTSVVSTLLSESISPPSEEFVTYPQEIGEVTSPFLFSISLPYQDDMRKARGGTWENVIYGYSSSNTFIVYRGLIEIGDKLLTGTQVRNILSYTSVTPSDGEYSWEFPRLGTSGTGSVTGGYLYDDSASLFPFVEEGEIVLLNDTPYFCEPRAEGYLHLSAIEITLDSVAEDTGLIEGTFLDYPWITAPLRYRFIELFGDGTDEIEIRVPLKRVHKGLPLLAEDLIFEVGAPSVERFVASLNKIYFSDVVASGERVFVGVPISDEDFVNITALNDTRFRLNLSRTSTQVETTASRGFYTGTNTSLASLGRFTPANVLWKSTPIRPYSEEVYSRKVELMGSRTTNTPSMTLNNNFLLNKTYSPQATPTANIRGYATKSVLNRDGKIPYSDLGFKPKFLISIESGVVPGAEYEGTLTDRYVLVPSAPLNHPLVVTAISVEAYESSSWAKGEILSEGQPSFDSSDSLLENALSSLSAPSVEDIMDNPKGLIIRDGASDQNRGIIHSKTTSASGKVGERVFYSDEFTSLAISGLPFISEIDGTTDPLVSRRPSLTLNSTDTHIGFDSVLARSREVLRTDVFLELILPLAETEAFVEDSLPLISDEALGVFAWALSDSISPLSDEVGVSISPVLNEALPLILDEVEIATAVTISVADTLPAQTDDASGDLVTVSASVGDSVPTLSDEADGVLNITSASVTDAIPTMSDVATGDYNTPADFTLYAALTANQYTVTDTERVIIYTSDDYFSRRGSATPTLFSSFPTSAVYADSNGATLLTNSDTRRGFLKTLVQPYTNTTPPSANISWKVKGGSVIDGQFEPDITYNILARTTYDDGALSDISVAYLSAPDGSNTFSVMGASPTYVQLYPSSNGSNTYYKHTFSVDNAGAVTFTPDNIPKAPVFSGSCRVYFYIQNNDGGLGAGASVASSIRVLNGAGTSFQVPSIHVPSEVSNVSGTATFVKSTISNTDNVSQVSWILTPATDYRIIVDRDSAVDFKIFMRVRSGTGSSEYNTLYSSADTLDYRGFDNSKRGVMFYLQILEDGNVLITN
jgi:hypothetical protein